MAEALPPAPPAPAAPPGPGPLPPFSPAPRRRHRPRPYWSRQYRCRRLALRRDAGAACGTGQPGTRAIFALLAGVAVILLVHDFDYVPHAYLRPRAASDMEPNGGSSVNRPSLRRGRPWAPQRRECFHACPARLDRRHDISPTDCRYWAQTSPRTMTAAMSTARITLADEADFRMDRSASAPRSAPW